MKQLKASIGFYIIAYAFPAYAGYLHGSIFNKVQVDNRQAFSHNGRQFAESWGDFYYDDKFANLHGGLLVGARYQNANPHYELYRAFVRKGFKALHSEITLGRFERADNLGMYSIDGGDWRYHRKWFNINFYAGKPRRIEDLKSERGDSVFGTESILKLQPEWRSQHIPLTMEQARIRIGYQRFKFKNITHRIEFGTQLEGKINAGDDSSYQLTSSGTYLITKQQFRDLLVEGIITFNKNYRIRGRYQRYNPKSGFLTFRERFFQFLTRERQQLYELGFQRQPRYDIKWYLNGLRITRAHSFTGYGAKAGFQKRWQNLTLTGQFHYLDYGTDSTKSLYFGLRTSPTSKLSLHLRTVLRDEQKQLYGSNRVIGNDLDIQYMIDNDLVISANGTYIWNSKRSGEYLGSLAIRYYFDYFKPKEAQ